MTIFFMQNATTTSQLFISDDNSVFLNIFLAFNFSLMYVLAPQCNGKINNDKGRILLPL